MAIIIRVALPSVIIQGGVLPWRLKSIINIAGVRRARRRSTSAPPVWRGFLFAIIARRAAVGRTYRQQLIGAVFAMSLLALGRNGRSQAGAEASGLDSLSDPTLRLYILFLSHPVSFPFLFSLQHPLFSSLFSRGNHQIFRALSRV